MSWVVFGDDSKPHRAVSWIGIEHSGGDFGSGAFEISAICVVGRDERREEEKIETDCILVENT